MNLIPRSSLIQTISLIKVLAPEVEHNLTPPDPILITRQEEASAHLDPILAGDVRPAIVQVPVVEGEAALGVGNLGFKFYDYEKVHHLCSNGVFIQFGRPCSVN